MSYCNINDIPTPKDYDTTDFKLLIDFQQQLRREQQKIDERIKFELF